MRFRFTSLVRPQFSLRSLSLAAFLVCAVTGWLAQHSHDYQREQATIASIGERVARGKMVTVATNGQTEYLAGDLLM